MPEVSPLLAPILHSLQQAREDLATLTAGLTDEQVWARPFGLAPLGFQLRHIAGSVDRLITYLLGNQLDDAQMSALRAEMEPGGSRDELLALVNVSLARGEEVIRSLNIDKLADAREVGRRRLPTTVIGLAIHIAEHTQRHVGQAISAAKLAAARNS